MSCCIENAILDALRLLTCTPIRTENHFADRRKCTDCIPYLVLKASETAGLRTSSGTQSIWTIDIKAYFDDSKSQMARDYRDLVRTWLYGGGRCTDLGLCGCFCIQGAPSSSIRTVDKEIVYSLVFRGSYQMAESGSASLSASV